MKIKPEETLMAVKWINNQFETNGRFPACCAEQENTNYAITLQHVKAYTEWTKTSASSDAVSQWADNWLNTYEVKQLLQNK